jgi:molybdopterin synthase sulfur carrier subunit
MATVRIPTPLRKFTQGKDEVSIDETGAVRRFVNVFVADEDIRFLDNLDTAVKDGDEVSIVPAIAGGR